MGSEISDILIIRSDIQFSGPGRIFPPKWENVRVTSFLIQKKNCDTFEHPQSVLSGGIGRQVKSSLRCSISRFEHCTVFHWSQKRKTGNTPTGPKKVKSKFLLGECCFFALMRVAFKSRALRARFAKVGFSNSLHGCVGCAAIMGRGHPFLVCASHQ